jgi:hypothetical protein
MIATLLTQLKTAEATAQGIAADALKIYNDARDSGDFGPSALQALDPGRHQIMLGAIRTAMEYGQMISTSATPKVAPAPIPAPAAAAAPANPNA